MANQHRGQCSLNWFEKSGIELTGENSSKMVSFISESDRVFRKLTHAGSLTGGENLAVKSLIRTFGAKKLYNRKAITPYQFNEE